MNKIPTHELKWSQLVKILTNPDSNGYCKIVSLFLNQIRWDLQELWLQKHLLHDLVKRWTRITGLMRITNCVNVGRQLVKCQGSFPNLDLSSTWGWPTLIPLDWRPPHASGAFDLLIFSKNLKTSFCQSAQSQIILLPPPIQLPSSTLSLLCSHTV